jgi:PAS domain S-box-containing protein
MLKLSFGKSIKTQLIVLLFGLTAVSIGVVGFLGVRGLLDSGKKAQEITSESMQTRAEQLLEQTTSTTAQNNSLLFQTIDDEVATIGKYVENVFDNPGSFTSSWKFDSHVFKKPSGQWWNDSSELPNILLGNYITTPSTALKKEIELLHNLDFVAPQVVEKHPNAVALYFIGALGESFYYPNIDLGSIIPPDLNPNTLDFYTVAAPENNPEREVKWTPVYDDPAGNGLTITASYPVYSPKNTFRGVMSIDVTLNNIAKSIEAYSPIESSYSFLIDKNGRAIALPAAAYQDMLGREQKNGEFGVDLSKVAGEFGTVLKDMRGGKQGFKAANTTDGQHFVAYAPLAGTEFSLGIVAQRDVLLQVVSDLQAQVKKSTNQVLYFQILPFAVLILLMVWVLGFVYIRYLTEPIIALTEKTNRIMQGSLREEIEVKTSNNEVGTLARAFNKMISELGASYKALERKVVEIGDAKAKDDAILNSIGDGLIVTDEAGEILLINKIASDLTGITSDKPGQKVTDRVMYDDAGNEIAPEEQPLMVALKTGKKINRYVLAPGKDDAKIILNITANPVKEHDRHIGAIEIIRDVTEEKEVERMKTEFISVASHQLRTPLSATKWFSQMLLNGDAGKLQDGQIDFVKNISSSTDRMIELVNSLLNISRLESGKIMVEPTPTDLKKMVTDLTESVKQKAEEKKLKLDVKVDEKIPQINLDPRLISQVYSSLLTNAMNYTSKGSVAVTVNVKDKDVVSEITDTGIGIPAGEQKKVFNKFYRGTNVKTVETDGTGLGVYLAKVIVESHGGKIGFESQEGKGTTFWFSLPVKGLPPAASKPGQASHSEEKEDKPE